MKYLKTFESHSTDINKTLIKFEDGNLIYDPEEIKRLLIEAPKGIKPEITPANDVNKDGELLKVITDKELEEMTEYLMTQPSSEQISLLSK